MATPTHCTLYHGRRAFHALEHSARRTALEPDLQPQLRPPRQPCPGQIRPFNPRLVAGTSNPTAGAFSAFTLKLDREDGDQFLGDLNFTMPPGLHRQPARDHLLPGGGDRRGRPTPGRTEQADPELPGLSADRHHQRRRRARAPTPSTRSARSTWPGPFKGAPLSPRRDHPGAGRPL